jgi:hypothetical protein
VCQAWEYFHKGLGYSAVIIAFATIYTGLQTVAPDASDAVKGLYAAWIAITLACFGLLQLWWWRWGQAAFAARNNAPSAKATPNPAFAQMTTPKAAPGGKQPEL